MCGCHVVPCSTGHKASHSRVKLALRELVGFLWSFLHLYFFILNEANSCKVYLLLTARFLIYLLETVAYYALILTVISNSTTDPDTTFLVGLVNAILNCQPTTPNSRPKRSPTDLSTLLETWHSTSFQEEDLLNLLQTLDNQNVESTPTPVATSYRIPHTPTPGSTTSLPSLAFLPFISMTQTL